jgi:hypothetical protein
MCLANATRIRTVLPADGAAIGDLARQNDEMFRLQPVDGALNGTQEQPECPATGGLILEWSASCVGAVLWTHDGEADHAQPGPIVIELIPLGAEPQTIGWCRRLLEAAEGHLGGRACDSLEVVAPLECLPALTSLGFRPERLVRRTLATGEACAAVVVRKVLPSHPGPVQEQFP